MKKVYDMEGVGTDVKRFPIPAGIEVKCPSCGETHTFNERCDYLSYPWVGDTGALYFCCESCDKCWTVEATLRASVKIGKVTEQ